MGKFSKIFPNLHGEKNTFLSPNKHFYSKKKQQKETVFKKKHLPTLAVIGNICFSPI